MNPSVVIWLQTCLTLPCRGYNAARLEPILFHFNQFSNCERSVSAYDASRTSGWTDAAKPTIATVLQDLHNYDRVYALSRLTGTMRKASVIRVTVESFCESLGIAQTDVQT